MRWRGRSRFPASHPVGARESGLWAHVLPAAVIEAIRRSIASAPIGFGDVGPGLALVVGWVVGTAVLARLSGLAGCVLLIVVAWIVVTVRSHWRSKTRD